MDIMTAIVSEDASHLRVVRETGQEDDLAMRTRVSMGTLFNSDWYDIVA